MSISYEARALLTLVSQQRKGRISYALLQRDQVMQFADPLLNAGYIEHRRLGYDEGFQITEAGREYLAGEAI